MLPIGVESRSTRIITPLHGYCCRNAPSLSSVSALSLSLSGAHPWLWRSLPSISFPCPYFHPWKCCSVPPALIRRGSGCPTRLPVATGFGHGILFVVCGEAVCCVRLLKNGLLEVGCVAAGKAGRSRGQKTWFPRTNPRRCGDHDDDGPARAI